MVRLKIVAVVAVVAAVVMVVVGIFLFKMSWIVQSRTECMMALKECQSYVGFFSAIDKVKNYPMADCCRLGNTTDSLCKFIAEIRHGCHTYLSAFAIDETTISTRLPSACHFNNITANDCPGATYCVCIDGADETALQKNIDYACGAGADCSAILQNGACYQPNTVKSHCDYAVNNYFQKMGQVSGCCNFSGTATLTNTLPVTVVSGCTYPSSSSQVSGAPPTGQ